jgi:hypothetical protein
MTEAQVWIAKAQKWRVFAQTAEDSWTTDQLLWLAAQAEIIALEAWPRSDWECPSH